MAELVCNDWDELRRAVLALPREQWLRSEVVLTRDWADELAQMQPPRWHSDEPLMFYGVPVRVVEGEAREVRE